MPRPSLPKKFKSPRDLPWQLILSVGLSIAREGRERWSRLEKREQQEVVRIMRKSKARVTNLTEHERAELRRIVWKAAGPRE